MGFANPRRVAKSFHLLYLLLAVVVVAVGKTNLNHFFIPSLGRAQN